MNELIVEIMKVALEKSHREKNTIFINFSGHVEWFDIEVYKNGWYMGATESFSNSVKLNKENVEQELQKTLSYLKSL